MAKWIYDCYSPPYSVYKCSECGRRIYLHTRLESEAWVVRYPAIRPKECPECKVEMERTYENNQAVL